MDNHTEHTQSHLIQSRSKIGSELTPESEQQRIL